MRDVSWQEGSRMLIKPQVCLTILLAILSFSPCSEGTEVLRGPVFDAFEIQDLDVPATFRKIVELSRAVDPDGIGVNTVLDTTSLADAQTKALISVSAKNVRVADLVWAICKRLGLGIRLDPNALYISGGGKTRLIDPPNASALKLVQESELKIRAE
jgi:hypothetical protein